LLLNPSLWDDNNQENYLKLAAKYQLGFYQRNIGWDCKLDFFGARKDEIKCLVDEKRFITKVHEASRSLLFSKNKIPRGKSYFSLKLNGIKEKVLGNTLYPVMIGIASESLINIPGAN
jgi:hypothetical protein